MMIRRFPAVFRSVMWGCVATGFTGSVVLAVDPPKISSTSQPVAATLPTTQPTNDAQGVRQLLDDHQYTAAIKLASKLLLLKGKAAEGQNRYELTMLKGEGQLGAKTISLAISTFESAVKETTDPHEIAVAQWTAELVRRSSGMKYTPKTTPAGGIKPAPIDLLDRAQRPAAFSAMFDDEMAVLQPKIDSAKTARNLPQVYPVLDKLGKLKQLDIIANGNDDKTAKNSAALLDHARELMSSALKGMWTRVNDIEHAANQTTTIQQTVMINGNPFTQNITRKNGLSPANQQELKDDIDTCNKIQQAANDLSQLAKNDKDWAPVMNDADRVSGKAKDVMNADYGSGASDNPENISVPTGTGTTPVHRTK
jgi:hypothetical protein